MSFGIIQKLYYHSLWPSTHEPKVIAECTWYKYHGVNPINGLTQVRLHSPWNEGCSVAFLSDCVSMQCMFWPSHPFAENKSEREEYMDVLLHHDEMPPFDKD